MEAKCNEMKKGTTNVCQNPDMEVVTGVREETLETSEAQTNREDLNAIFKTWQPDGGWI